MSQMVMGSFPFNGRSLKFHRIFSTRKSIQLLGYSHDFGKPQIHLCHYIYIILDYIMLYPIGYPASGCSHTVLSEITRWIGF